MNGETTKERFSMISNHATPFSQSRLRGLALAVLAVASMAFLAIPAGSASAAVAWDSETYWGPTQLVAGKSGRVNVEVANIGDTAASQSAPTEVQIDLPPGVTAVAPLPKPFLAILGGWTCTGEGTETVNCIGVYTGFGFKPPKAQARMIRINNILFSVAPDATGTGAFVTTVNSAEAASPSVVVDPVTIGDTPLGFGLDPASVAAGAYDESGGDFTQAGGHPYVASASFRPSIDGSVAATYEGGNIADIVTTLPPGFVGDPGVTAKCTEAEFSSMSGCPADSQVGILLLYAPLIPDFQTAAVFNMVPRADQVAQFGFLIPWAGPQRVNPSVRSDGDYGITMTVPNITEAGTAVRSELIVWGAPADPSHDDQRCERPHAFSLTCTGFDVAGEPVTNGEADPRSSSLPVQALLTNPTNCADLPRTNLLLDSYQNRVPDIENINDPRWKSYTVNHPAHTGCPQVPFGPTMTLRPTSKEADSPTGLDAHLHFPRENDRDPDRLVQAHLKKTTVTLPEGISLNASAADGLQACSMEQIGLTSAPGAERITFDNEEPSCPDASKIGNGEVFTDLLPNPLRGEVFLAAQDQNPFNSTYAIYLVVREPSILVKLAGKVEADPVTGRLKTTFDNNPQLPFTDLRLGFYGGERAALATPQRCGTFTSQTDFVPWSAADPDNPTPAEVVSHPDSFSIDGGAGGAPCPGAALPFETGLAAGSTNPIAGAHSAFSIRITRPDGAQELDTLHITPPPGLTASLRGTPYCPEPLISTARDRAGREEQASPTCPEASQIGTTLSGAGAGSRPFFAAGKLYLAGPYKGAPLSVVAVTPAVAGPFDLGNVVVRSALRIDPRTARITAVTDPLPRMLEGVPLRIRDLRIQLDRPNWTINPTSCAEMAVNVTAFGAGGGVSQPATRFQLDGCRKLGFKPRLSLRLIGGTTRSAHPKLRAVVRPRRGDANIGRAAVTLPNSAFLDQAHIRTICTRVQFAADNCPKAAIYGYAIAQTPLLDEALKGPVYLRSSDNNLPDLVADLRGPEYQPIRIELVGRIDSVKGGIRNTFAVVPDAPVSRFVLKMQGGKKGLIVNSRNLCEGTNRARARLKGHNGARYNFRPTVVAANCKKGNGRKQGAKRPAGR